jgi:translation initiation factor IF-3
MLEGINDSIRAREVRAVFPDGSVEVMATSLAIRKAQSMGLDLVLIAPDADPPVAKAMNYDEWQRTNAR